MGLMVKRRKTRTPNASRAAGLRRQLAEAREALRAIRQGEVDALVIGAPRGERVFTLDGAEQPYRVIVETMSEGAVTLAADGTVLYANRRFGRMVDRPLQKTIGASFKNFVAADYRDLCGDLIEDGAAAPTRGEFVLVGRRREPVPVYISAAPLQGDAGETICLVVTDISSLKKAQDAARESEQRFRTAAESVIGGFMICSAIRDRRGHIKDFLVEYINETGARLIGKKPTEMIGRRWLSLHPGGRESGLFDQYAAVVNIGKLLAYESAVEKGLVGKIFDVRAVKLGDGFAVASRDVTEIKRLERELVDVVNRERHQIGQELHDLLAQDLIAMAMLTKGLEQRLVDRDDAAAIQAAEVSELASHAAGHARDIARGLSPVELRADGLMTALREFAGATAELYKVDCIFLCDKPVLVHDDVAAMHLYRIAQEAVRNAIRHGKARRVQIRMAAQDGWGRIEIKDDGRGLPAQCKKAKGMGLRIMAHRAKTIGGVLTVASKPRRGTTVECRFCTGGESVRAWDQPPSAVTSIPSPS